MRRQNGNIREIVFSDSFPINVADVLTNIKRWQAYTDEYLEQKVNQILPEYFAEKLGAYAANLRSNLGYKSKDIKVSQDGIHFISGVFLIGYEARTKKAGNLNSQLAISCEAFDKGTIERLLQAFSMQPRLLQIITVDAIDIEGFADSLSALEWKIESMLPAKLQMRHLKYNFQCVVEPRSFTVEGFTISQLLGKGSGGSLLESLFSALNG